MLAIHLADMSQNPSFELIEKDLREQIELCKAIYHVIEREARELKSSRGDEDEPKSFKHTNEAREKLLPLLDRSTERIKDHRKIWENLDPDTKSTRPEINKLIVEALNTIMKIIKLDRSNEEILLKSGSIPIEQIPSSLRQKPKAVANIYRQNSR